MVQYLFTISKIFPLTFLRTLIPKIQPLRIKFFILFLKTAFPFTTTRTKSFESSGFSRKFPKKSLHYTKDKVNEKSVVPCKIFPREQKKTVTADKRADDLSPVLCLTVTVNPVISPYFSTHIRRNSLRPATSAHLIPTVRNYYFSVI